MPTVQHVRGVRANTTNDCRYATNAADVTTSNMKIYGRIEHAAATGVSRTVGWTDSATDSHARRQTDRQTEGRSHARTPTHLACTTYVTLSILNRRQWRTETPDLRTGCRRRKWSTCGSPKHSVFELSPPVVDSEMSTVKFTSRNDPLTSPLAIRSMRPGSLLTSSLYIS